MSVMGKPAKSTSGSAQAWAKPYATQAAQDVLDVYNQAQPGLQAVQGNITGQMGNLGQIGAGLNSQVGAYGATGGAANNYYKGVIGGNQLSGNPFVRNILGQLDESILNGVNSGFESGGRYGSGAYVGELAKQLGAANGQVLYSNYNDAANRQLQAAQSADQALAQQQQAQAANAQQQLAAAQLASQVPYTGINSLGNSLGALFNGGTQTGQKAGLLDYLSSAAQSAATAFAASDRRMKKGIVKVGEFDDGLGIYEWTYKHDPSNTRCRGVMADEVKRLRPAAYVQNYRGTGFDAVNYAAL